MYGLVLMAALATGSGSPSADATPAIVAAPYYGGCFSSGCCGGVVVSGGCYSTGCCGGYSSGCYGSSCYSSCNGCSGGGFLGLRSRVSGLFSSRRSSCSGCYGSSCYGSSCYGSSCYGSSCYGSSRYGSACYGGGCCGGSAVYYGSDFHGGYNTMPVYGYGSGMIVGSAPPVAFPSMSMEFDATITKPNAAPARLTVELPEGAKLFVDGQATKGEGTVRNFHTPELAKGQTFFYDLKAEVIVDGEAVTETKRILVRSGEALTESFPKLAVAVKAAKDPAFVVTKPR